MANAVLLLVLLAVSLYISRIVLRRRRALVPKRGFGIGADLGGLADAPAVRVEAVTRVGPDRVRVVFGPTGGSKSEPPDLEFVVSLTADDFGSEVLEEWRRDGSPVAIVIPPGSHLLRLRSLESLQHLTLRRVDGEP